MLPPNVHLTPNEIWAISMRGDIYNLAASQRALYKAMGARFPFAVWGKLDPSLCDDEIVVCNGEHLEDAYQIMRIRHLLYGPGYLLGDSNVPCLGLDVSDAVRFLELYLGFKVWVCDARLTWCIEVQSSGTVRFAWSPYHRLPTMLSRHYPSRSVG